MVTVTRTCKALVCDICKQDIHGFPYVAQLSQGAQDIGQDWDVCESCVGEMQLVIGWLNSKTELEFEWSFEKQWAEYL